MKKVKKKSRRKLIEDEIEFLCKTYIKKRDQHTCQWCKNKVSGRNEQWSHIIPKGSDSFLRWHPLNTKVLCLSCHRKWHNSPLEATEWFNKKYPGRYKYLKKIHNTNHNNFKINDIEEIRDWYIKAIKNLPNKIRVLPIFK